MLVQVMRPQRQEDHRKYAPVVPSPIFERFFRWEAQKLWPNKRFNPDRSILDQLDDDMERQLFGTDETTTENPDRIPRHKLLRF